jgi:TRAP-type C4-dicarboxylate transport system permease small subunit
MFSLLYRRAEAFARVIAYAGVMLLVATMLVTVADIVLRHTLKIAFFGVIDITQALVMAAAFAAIPFAFFSGQHVAVEMATDPLPRRALDVVKAVAALLAALFMLACLRYGWIQAAQQYGYGDRSQTIGIPTLWYWGPLLLGCALSTIAALLVALRHMLAAISGRDPVG